MLFNITAAPEYVSNISSNHDEDISGPMVGPYSSGSSVAFPVNLGVASQHQQYLGDLAKMILKEKQELMRIFLMVTLLLLVLL